MHFVLLFQLLSAFSLILALPLPSEKVVARTFSGDGTFFYPGLVSRNAI
jgi:hypothetical protein